MSTPTDCQEISDAARGTSSDQIIARHDSGSSSQHLLSPDDIELTTFEASGNSQANLTGSKSFSDSSLGCCI
jgi:hypothetical protein